MTGDFSDPATYVRRSTAEQEDEHQRSQLRDWLTDNDVEISEVEWYDDQGSGASDDREGYQQLLDDIRSDEITDVVVWEISRIGRRGKIIQEFFDACEDHDVTVHITDGKVDTIKPDGTNRFVADIVGMVYTEERRQLIRRTKAGVEHARKQGKWTGRAPVGFITTEDGYLKPNLDPDYENGECGFFDIVDALERIENGESYNSVADNTPNVTRYTLSTIDQERREWYLEGRAEDDRIEEAVKAAGVTEELNARKG